MRGEAFVLDEVDERAGDGAKADVAFIGAGDDEQDVDAVLRGPVSAGESLILLTQRSIWRSWAR